MANPTIFVIGTCLLQIVFSLQNQNYPLAVQLPTVVGNAFGQPGINATYDYVVVGGGTAGLAVAARLATNYSVAVIEAGSFYEVENGNGTIIPALGTYQMISTAGPLQPLIDWGFQTVPQAGALNRSIYYARGKTLGGSSARNLLAYHRPTIGSMQKWADEVGDGNYTWENVLPYFQNHVKITLPNESGRYTNSTIDFNDTSIVNGAQTGPLQVTWPNYAPAVLSWLYQAMQRIGLPVNHQAFLGGTVDGVAYTASTIDPELQQRSTSQSSYTYQAMLETDIKVYTRALAKEITFDGNNSASGVRVDSGGQSFHLTATKEVILSAGAFQSPQLLMVSGIGPRATLEQHNITVRKELPGVGQNMWDHAVYPTNYRVNVPTYSRLFNDAEYAADAARQYLTNKTGILTAPPGMLAWERLTTQNLSNITISPSTTEAMSVFPRDWPEIEYLLHGEATPDPYDGNDYASIQIAIISPLSRGNVTIRSADTADPPVINPNWLTHPADMDLLTNGLKRARQAWAAIPEVTIGAEYLPGPDVTTDAQIEHFIRSTVGPVWHLSATCKMGRSNDAMAVVDSTAKVYGVRNLRVVDASAFPFLPPGHPQSVVYMLAEKTADDILNGRVVHYQAMCMSAGLAYEHATLEKDGLPRFDDEPSH